MVRRRLVSEMLAFQCFHALRRLRLQFVTQTRAPAMRAPPLCRSEGAMDACLKEIAELVASNDRGKDFHGLAMRHKALFATYADVTRCITNDALRATLPTLRGSKLRTKVGRGRDSALKAFEIVFGGDAHEHERSEEEAGDNERGEEEAGEHEHGEEEAGDNERGEEEEAGDNEHGVQHELEDVCRRLKVENEDMRRELEETRSKLLMEQEARRKLECDRLAVTRFLHDSCVRFWLVQQEFEDVLAFMVKDADRDELLEEKQAQEVMKKSIECLEHMRTETFRCKTYLGTSASNAV